MPGDDMSDTECEKLLVKIDAMRMLVNNTYVPPLMPDSWYAIDRKNRREAEAHLRKLEEQLRQGCARYMD